MGVSAAQVKELRDRTGAGMMACKQALAEAGGDTEAAVAWLRKQGQMQALRRQGRATGEGLVGHYVHMGGRIGVLVELNCETDFVARTEDFQTLAREIAMHIAAARPISVSEDDLPSEVLQRETAILREQAEATGKPPAVVEKIVQGRLDKFKQEACLLEQLYVRDPDRTIKELIAEQAAKIGENLRVRRFVRFEVGEDIEAGY
jgi:elongation factor Ts